MSGSSAPVSCPACGAEAPPGAAFCPACGARLDSDATARAELPPHETTPAPVSIVQAELRLFGVMPPTLLFGLAASALTFGGFLLGFGHWIWAVILFAAAVPLLAAFLRVARRKPDAAFARTSVEAVDSLRARAAYAAQALRTRSSARQEVLRRRAELMRLAARRAELLGALGDAFYRDERRAVKRLKAELGELDNRVQAAEVEIRRVASGAQQRIEQAAMEVTPTEILDQTGHSEEN